MRTKESHLMGLSPESCLVVSQVEGILARRNGTLRRVDFKCKRFSETAVQMFYG